jgi:hypothetical protein
MLSPRTAKYVEAMIREGDDFDYHAWLGRIRDEEVRAKRAPVALSSGESVAAEVGELTIAPDRRDAWASAGPALPVKSVSIPSAGYRSHQKACGKGSKGRLKRRLMRVSDAFDEFQESRVRDAVYGYLNAVFALVLDCKGRRRTQRLLRRAFHFAGLPVDKNADPFAAVIRCTSERSVDNKTISKWARALRYAAHCKRLRTPLKRFVEKMGGINACAERYAIYLGRGSR